MNLLQRIVKKLARPEFKGIVVNVEQIYSKGKDYLHNHTLTLSHGYDADGMPITEMVTEGVFNVTLENSMGTRQTYETGIGIKPKIGTQQSCRL